MDNLLSSSRIFHLCIGSGMCGEGQKILAHLPLIISDIHYVTERPNDFFLFICQHLVNKSYIYIKHSSIKYLVIFNHINYSP